MSWPCGMCTYEHAGEEASLEVCAMCESPRPDPTPEPQAPAPAAAAARPARARSAAGAMRMPRMFPAPVAPTPAAAVALSRLEQEAADEAFARRMQQQFDEDELAAANNGGVPPAVDVRSESDDESVEPQPDCSPVASSPPPALATPVRPAAASPAPPSSLAFLSPPASVAPLSVKKSPTMRVATKRMWSAADLEKMASEVERPEKPDKDEDYTDEPEGRHVAKRRKNRVTSLTRRSTSTTRKAAPLSPAEPAAPSTQVVPAAAMPMSLAAPAPALSRASTTPSRLPPSGVSPLTTPLKPSAVIVDTPSPAPNLRRASTRLATPVASPAPAPSTPTNVRAAPAATHDDDAGEPIDHSPLWALRGSDTGGPFTPQALRTLLGNFLPGVLFTSSSSSSPSHAAVATNVRTDSELAHFVDCLYSVVRAHPGPYTLPPAVVSGLWQSMLSEHVTLKGAQVAHFTLVQLQALSPCTFLPSTATWTEWCRESLAFSVWLQQKETLKRSGVIDGIAKEIQSPLPGADVPAAASSAVTFSASAMFERRIELQRQQTISSQLTDQLQLEVYYAKWALKFDLMVRALAMDARAREQGIKNFARHYMPGKQMRASTDASAVDDEAAEQDEAAAAILAVSPPLLMSLILHSEPHLLHAGTLHASAEKIAKATGPNLHTEEEQLDQEMTGVPTRGPKGRGRSRATATRGRGRGRATSTSKRSRGSHEEEEQAELAEDEENGDDADDLDLDYDDSFHSWWMQLLEFLGLEDRTTASSSAPPARSAEQHEQVVATFRSRTCLAVLQQTVLRFVAILKEHTRQKWSELA